MLLKKSSMELGYLIWYYIAQFLNDGNYLLNSFGMVPFMQHNSD